MEEMLDDTLEGLDEDSELEDEAEAEVDQVLYEITDGKLGVAGAGKELPVRSKPFSALHCFILTRIPESQRPRGGSGERSGDGTDASSAEQSAQWIIEALRARCTRIFTSPSRLFMFLLHLSRVPAGCFILSSYRKPSPTLSSIVRLEMLPTRSFVYVARSARPAQVLLSTLLSFVESASTQNTGSPPGICFTSRVCCCCSNRRVCR